MLYTTNSDLFELADFYSFSRENLHWIFDQSAPDNRGHLEPYKHVIEIAPGPRSNDWLTIFLKKKNKKKTGPAKMDDFLGERPTVAARAKTTQK